MVSANTRADCLIARHAGSFLAEQGVPGFFVERERGFLDFRGAEHEACEALTAAFVLRRLEHLPSNTLSSSRRIDVHAAQLHCAIGRDFQAEHADHLVVLDGYPKAASVLAVIGRDAIDLFFEGTPDIHLEHFAEVRRGEEPVDGNE